MNRYRTVFLDRDGTINVKAEADYIRDPAELQLLPGAATAIGALNAAGCGVILVTNQRGVSLGRMTLADVTAVHDRLDRELAAAGAHLDAVYVCPHAADACECRKPLPGLLLQAMAEDPEVRPDRAVIVGDAEADVLAGHAAGITAIRLSATPVATSAEAVAPDLATAVRRYILPPDFGSELGERRQMAEPAGAHQSEIDTLEPPNG